MLFPHRRPGTRVGLLYRGGSALPGLSRLDASREFPSDPSVERSAGHTLGRQHAGLAAWAVSSRDELAGTGRQHQRHYAGWGPSNAGAGADGCHGDRPLDGVGHPQTGRAVGPRDQVRFRQQRFDRGPLATAGTTQSLVAGMDRRRVGLRSSMRGSSTRRGPFWSDPRWQPVSSIIP